MSPARVQRLSLTDDKRFLHVCPVRARLPDKAFPNTILALRERGCGWMSKNEQVDKNCFQSTRSSPVAALSITCRAPQHAPKGRAGLESVVAYPGAYPGVISSSVEFDSARNSSNRACPRFAEIPFGASPWKCATNWDTFKSIVSP